MPLRIVVLQFKPRVRPDEVAIFESNLRKMADCISYKLGVQCGSGRSLKGEPALDANAPMVENGDFVAVWEFANETDLERFVTDPAHRNFAAMAKNYVARRVVVNLP